MLQQRVSASLVSRNQETTSQKCAQGDTNSSSSGEEPDAVLLSGEDEPKSAIQEFDPDLNHVQEHTSLQVDQCKAEGSAQQPWQPSTNTVQKGSMDQGHQRLCALSGLHIYSL